MGVVGSWRNDSRARGDRGVGEAGRVVGEMPSCGNHAAAAQAVAVGANRFMVIGTSETCEIDLALPDGNVYVKEANGREVKTSTLFPRYSVNHDRFPAHTYRTSPE
jgi:hypothetical protein